MKTHPQAELAIIGGSGLNELEFLQQATTHEMETPWGAPSCPILLGQWQGKSIAFLARHGRPHHLPPHAINYRANIFALKQLNVRAVVAVNVVGGIHVSMRQPGQWVVPDQMIDYTHGRMNSFCDAPGEAVKHIDFSFPYDESIRQSLLEVMKSLKIHCNPTGVYGCTQGPRLETLAEIVRMQRDGCGIVGMTGMPEACLARELDLAYASLCLVVNPAAGLAQGVVSLEDIERQMQQGMVTARRILSAWVEAHRVP